MSNQQSRRAAYVRPSALSSKALSIASVVVGCLFVLSRLALAEEGEPSKPKLSPAVEMAIELHKQYDQPIVVRMLKEMGYSTGYIFGWQSLTPADVAALREAGFDKDFLPAFRHEVAVDPIQVVVSGGLTTLMWVFSKACVLVKGG